MAHVLTFVALALAACVVIATALYFAMYPLGMKQKRLQTRGKFSSDSTSNQ